MFSISVSIMELSDIQYMMSRWHNKKKTDMMKSHYALVIRAALRWMLHVSAAFPHHEIHECKYPRIKSHARSLHHSPFSFLFRISFHPTLFLCSSLHYSSLALLHNRSNFNSRRASWYAPPIFVLDLMNATPHHLSTIDNSPRFFPR